MAALREAKEAKKNAAELKRSLEGRLADVEEGQTKLLQSERMAYEQRVSQGLEAAQVH